MNSDIRCIAATVKGPRCKRRGVMIAGKRQEWCRQHWEQLHRMKSQERKEDRISLALGTPVEERFDDRW